MKTHVLLLVSILFFSGAGAQIINFPDANFKARLLAASPSNDIASTETPYGFGSVGSYSTIDTNGDGEIQVSEASAIKYLSVTFASISNLDGINSFINLLFLRCSNNSLTNLNVSGLTNLLFLRCSNNSLTSLNVSGMPNLEIFDCSINPLTSLNVSGLTNLQRLYCHSNSLTSLNVSGLTNLEELKCQSNSLTSLNVSGLTNLQELFCYNNELTDLNVSGLSNLVSLSCSNNSLTSLNVSSLTNLQAFNCGFNQLTSINVSGLYNLYALGCSNNSLTSLNVNGFSNFSNLDCSNNQLESLFIKTNNLFDFASTLYFDNNPSLQYICADDQDIAFVQQKINDYGYASTCTVNSYCSFTPGGVFYTIQGNNKLDGNSNGCDATDGFNPNLRFSITDGTNSGSLISNASGNYSIPVSAGTHTITPQLENSSYFTVSPTNVTVTFPATASPFVQDFCIVPNGVHHDLEVVIIPLEPARPGFDATYKIKYKNKGNQNETATLVFDFNDDVLDYVSSTLAPTSTGIGLLSWNIGTIIPFQSGEFVVTLNVNSPMETPAVNAGDILNYTAIINGLNTDETPIDNTFTLSQIVVNSFDPNDKTCLEGTTINPTMIGDYVHYQIRFENTGTFPAQNVVIKDMIDTAKFDISTLQITDTSHSCVTKITNPNKVEFIFENINLPFDDATNDGYVVFKIKTKPTLTVGSTISNLANIYFDYNFPIVTNTATSTFQALANSTFNLDNYISLSPNPAKDILNINVQDEINIKSIAIYNMLGQLVQITTSPISSINVSDLKTGNYVIKLYIEKGEIIRKFIKE
ncbi:T9SS type A sorting domain-containing protein [Flavobacterium cheonanense]|uniref:T9SS type A sorting domain-containing protein n=1 Tax=Flavobacterium cheonanense TaxID=706183 RepID=A0ABP7VGX4_9FLAO